LLMLHRLPSKRGHKKASPGTSTGKPVVYLHHGLLMNSEVWVCLTDAERSVAFSLAERGFDVWLGACLCTFHSVSSLISSFR
jgi:lysosomal acid lipase/cholesteryl ester hydrolase